MAIQKLWYVVSLNQNYIPLEFGADADPVPRAPARDRDRGLLRPAQLEGGRPIKVALDAKKAIKQAFTSEEAAVTEAQSMATKFPKEPFGVLGIVSVFETVPADPIRKSFSDTGELVVHPGV